MSAACRCATRESLELLLGPPCYALEGHLYSIASTTERQAVHPEVVEVYEKDGCSIELFFNDGQMSSMIAMAYPTSWELATDALGTNAT